MDYAIPCETYVRLTNVLKQFRTDETRDWLKSVYVEHKGGKAFAVASNSAIMAIEFLGNVTAPDGSINLTIDPALIAQCQTEAAFNSILYVTVNEMLRFASAKTTLGYNYPGNAAVMFEGANDLARWREIIPDALPKKSKGAMFMDTEWITNLGKSSPSGRIVFAANIDNSVPVVVRDLNDPNWIGLFMPNRIVDGKVSSDDAAEIPGWVK